MDFCVVLTTAPNPDVAQQLAEGLVSRGLAACVQILPITSYYLWKGELCRDSELLLLAKTTTARYPDVEAHIRESHPYEVPEIIRLPIEAGWEPYLAWVRENTTE